MRTVGDRNPSNPADEEAGARMRAEDLRYEACRSMLAAGAEADEVAEALYDGSLLADVLREAARAKPDYMLVGMLMVKATQRALVTVARSHADD